MATAKFYYYNIWVRGEDGEQLTINESFDDKLFSEDNYEISSEENKFYFTRFQLISAKQHHGVLMRAKDEEGFVRLNEEMEINVLSDQTEGEGQTGSLDRDYVNFAVKVNRKSLDVLMEVGYQTPGILKFKEYLSHHIDSNDVDKIGHETRMPELDEEKIDRLLESDLKSAEVSFKKHPKSITGVEVESTLSNLLPDEYRLKLEVSLERGADEETNVREAIGRIIPFFESDEDDIQATIRQIDFPRVMNTFKITGFEEDTEEEIEANLAETVDKEEIDMSAYSLFDERLGQHLCNKLSQKY